MADVLKSAWWVLVLRGIGAILFALLLLLAPGLTLAGVTFSFVILFGVYALFDGFSNIIGAVRHREGQWFLLLLWGVISVIAGVIALGNPLLFGALTLTIMVYIVAFRSIAGGIAEIISAVQLRREINNEWLLAINGVFALLFGFILLARPITGIEVLVILTAFYLLMAGVLQIVFGFKMRGWSSALSGKQSAATT